MLMSLTSVAFASPKINLLDLSLEELGNIVVTGPTRTEKTVRNTPSAITVFTRADLQLLAVYTLEDLMNLVPGMQSFRSSENHLAEVGSIRGRRTAANDREMLVLLNGMRIEGFYGGGFNSSLVMLPLANIARVEFIRGPGSAVYGSNAFTGVINLVTVDDVRELSFSGGDRHQAGHWQHDFVTDNLRGATFLQARADQGQAYSVQDSFGPDVITTRDPYRNLNLQQQLTINNDTHLQLTAAHSDKDDFYHLGRLDNGYNQSQFDFAGLMLGQTLDWHESIKSDLDLGWKFSRYASQGLLAVLPPADKFRFKADLRSSEYWLSWHNDWTQSPSSSLQFGAEYRHPEVLQAEGQSNFDPAEVASGSYPFTHYPGFEKHIPLSKEARMDVASFYGQWQMDWNAYLSSILGLRYDKYSNIGDHLSPRLGLLFHVDKYNTFKLLAGDAFRAPQTDELYTTNNPLVHGNPELEPETVTTGELIWLHQRRHGQFTLNYFYNEFKDAIDLALVNGLSVFQNLPGTGTSDGVEAELQLQASPALKLLATATALFKTPDSFFREAKDLYSFSALYQGEQVYGSASAYYRSERQTLLPGGRGLNRLDSYWIINTKLGYRWTPQWRTELDLLNLQDRQFVTPDQTAKLPYGVHNRRRELRLTLALDY